MSLQGTSTGATTGRWAATSPGSGPGRGLVIAVTLLAGVFMVAAGVWALLAPDSFADAAGFLVGNLAHTVNHAVDQHLGGHALDPWGLGALTLLTGIALVVRLRQLGWVIGEVGLTTTPTLAPFVRQKTVVLTSYRRDGRPVGTPVSIAVDGDRAVVRSFEKAGKTRRIGRNPVIEVAPSTARGTPAGPGINARARRLEGAEASRAARLLAAKHPLLHGLLVPLTHRLVAPRPAGRSISSSH